METGRLFFVWIARNCNELAEAAENWPFKTRYKRMAAAWLDLAEEQDWLDGQTPPVKLELKGE